MCDLSQPTLNCSLRDCLYCETVSYIREEIPLFELAAWKLFVPSLSKGQSVKLVLP